MKQQEDQLYFYSHKPRVFFLLLLINIFSPFKHEKQQLSRTAQKPIKKKINRNNLEPDVQLFKIKLFNEKCEYSHLKKKHAVHFFPVVFNEAKLCMHLKTGEVTLWELRFFDLLNENVIKCVLQIRTL